MLLTMLVCVVCGRNPRTAAVGPLFDGLGTTHRSVTTDSPEAQRRFDQGLVFYYAFNHAEADRSFRDAAQLDDGCAMAYWGVALAAGPHINNPVMDEASSKTAYEAIQQALQRMEACSPVERELITALAERYADPPPSDRAPLNIAYAEAMRAVWRNHPEDPDVGALFAESLMDLRPWDLWSSDGEPRPETPEVMSTLEAVLALQPDHIGANHFYIHTMEASPEPGKAAASADRLRDLVPAAGHLVHMPAHIDIRLGQYDAAIEANRRAIEADLRYLEQTGRGGFYTIYRAHNYHFLTYAAMFAGRRDLSLDAAHDLIEQVPQELVRELPQFLDGFMATPVHAMVRFGMWQELIEMAPPAEDLPATRAFWRYGRSVAFSALGRVEEAAVELDSLEAASTRVPEDYTIGNNTVRVVLDVARPFARGELEYRRGNHERAFELLREAVRKDDALRYDEPWGWMEPVRHALGALLLEQGRVVEAEAVYREDLRIHPNNGWALHGLAECLRSLGRHAEAAEAQSRFEAAWSHSDVAIGASCYCRTTEGGSGT